MAPARAGRSGDVVRAPVEMNEETAAVTVGIDLGTTNSAVAVMTPDGPRLIPNALGDVLTPSVVGLDASDRILVGRAARELQVVAPDRCASVFKREMGLPTQRSLAGRKFGAVELSSLVLKSLLVDARKQLGDETSSAVITVPAYFNNHQRRATMLAGRMAGWDVRRIINEPTAAALAYGLHEANSRRTVAVFDLGGGTFDISLVDYFEGAVEVRASAGESVLGGEDFTRALAREVLSRQGLAYEQVELKQPARLARLIQQCELAKRSLTRESTARIRLPQPNGDLTTSSPEIELDRASLERCCEPVLSLIATPVRRALGDAGIDCTGLDEVILVGGATRMPCVFQLAERLFRRPPTSRLNPDEVVALGAAVQAALLDGSRHVDDLVVVDVSPFSLGVEVSKKFGRDIQDGYYSPILHRNTVIPASRVETFSTLQPWQESIQLNVYQGEARRVAENLLIGSLTVNGIPSTATPQQVRVRFTYDCNGVLEVEAEVVETGAKVSVVIAGQAAQLDEASLADAVRKMQALKFHPREDEANLHALRRADRIYRETSPDTRDALGLRIDLFEQALESQDPARINQARGFLDELLDQLDDTGAGP